MDSRYPIIITLTGFQVANEAHCLLLLNTKDFQLVFWTWPSEKSEMKLEFLPFSFNHLVQAKIPADGQKSEKYRGRCYWQKPLIYVETTF